MRTPKSYTDALNSGIITPEIVGEVIYSFNKRAKNARNSEHSYRESRRWYGYRDRYHNESRSRDTKEDYYRKKDSLLALFKPSCIHVVMVRINTSVLVSEYNKKNFKDPKVDTWIYKRQINRYTTVDVYRVSHLVPRYFLYYEIGGYQFHSPLPDSYKKRLKKVKIDSLTTYGKDINELLSTKYCDAVLEGLMKGTLKLAKKKKITTKNL